jgi:hypothetical protein
MRARQVWTGAAEPGHGQGGPFIRAQTAGPHLGHDGQSVGGVQIGAGAGGGQLVDARTPRPDVQGLVRAGAEIVDLLRREALPFRRPRRGPGCLRGCRGAAGQQADEREREPAGTDARRPPQVSSDGFCASAGTGCKESRREPGRRQARREGEGQGRGGAAIRAARCSPSRGATQKPRDPRPPRTWRPGAEGAADRQPVGGGGAERPRGLRSGPSRSDAARSGKRAARTARLRSVSPGRTSVSTSSRSWVAPNRKPVPSARHSRPRPWRPARRSRPSRPDPARAEAQFRRQTGRAPAGGHDHGSGLGQHRAVVVEQRQSRPRRARSGRPCR